MKYGDESSECPISIELQLHPSKLVFIAINSVKPDVLDKFYAFAHKLVESDPQELYISQLEESVSSEHANTSGLGILTMINDYCAQVGWKLESVPDRPQEFMLTTMVQLAV
jgi:hypothetical protein